MKKILILSMAGKTNEDEDLKNLHLYLLSIKEKLVPFYDVFVILYNASNSNQKTIELVKQYGLENVVNVRRLDDMELPIESYNFINSTYFASRIGLVMNMMFDYAKNNDFFGAEWIFQTDTDTEFLDSFRTTLDKCEEMRQLKEEIFISQMGDINDANLEIDNKLIYFRPPRRLNLYNSNEEFDNTFNSYEVEVVETQNEVSRPAFNCDALKIKNDFVGFSRRAAQSVSCNWTGVASYITLHNSRDITIEHKNDANFKSSKDITITINKDKGGLILRDMQFGKFDVIHIQLPCDTVMRHLNGGWIHKENYHTRALDSLETNYKNYESIWRSDFSESQSVVEVHQDTSNNELDTIKNKIFELEISLAEIQNLLKNLNK